MTGTHPQNRCLGYVRVSTYGQTLDTQLEQLRGAGCAKIYREKVTGAHSDRRELLKMLAALAPSDVVTVTRIDRLARSTFDLFAIVKQIVDAKAQFRSLAEPWADTDTSTGRLMIAVLGALVDVERDLIRTRTAEAGAAKAQGQQMGRPPALSHSGTAARGHPAPRAGRYARRTRPQLQRRHIHHSPRHQSRMTTPPRHPIYTLIFQMRPPVLEAGGYIATALIAVEVVLIFSLVRGKTTKGVFAIVSPVIVFAAAFFWMGDRVTEMTIRGVGTIKTAVNIANKYVEDEPPAKHS
jgi:DNA invertase Pin-like site-specific DNA recombinase